MQKRDQYTTVENFLEDNSFKNWILENDDSGGWELWTVENQQRAKLVDEARLWLLAMHLPKGGIALDEIQEQLDRTWNKIENSRMGAKRSKVVWLKMAASITVIFTMMGALYFGYQKSGLVMQEAFEKEMPRDLISKVNKTNTPLLVLLSDGSSVLLQPHSKLLYPAQFDSSKRQVFLYGDAFFEISKNKNWPFYVHANELITKVVGTSFRIRAFPERKDVEVVVRTGKVNVTAKNTEGQGLELLPNEGVRLTRQNLRFEKIEDLTQEKILSQELSNIEKLSFEFTDVPVLQIFKTVEQAYGVVIEFSNKKLENCYLTTSLSDQPLTEKLNIICESLGEGTSFKIINNRIIIYSDGCN